MKKAALVFSVLMIFGLLIVTNPKAALAGPHQSFSPSSGNYKVGQSFSVTATMTSGGEVIGGADGIGTYDSNILELVSIETASSMVFDTTDDGGGCMITEAESGKFAYSCYSNSNTSSNSNSGDLVVFNFKAKAVGTGQVKFTCTQDSTTDTNITKTSPVGDIIVCSENVNGTYVITEGDSNLDPVGEEPIEEEPASELPQTGGFGATVGLILFGVVSVASAVFLRFL